jgi:hypothetical protein
MNTSDMPISSASSRALRVIARVVLGLIFTLLFALAVVTACLGGGYIAPALLAAGATLMVVVPRRLRMGPWTRIFLGYALLAPVLVYLAIDDEVTRRPITMEQVGPGFPGAEKSFEVLMRYGKQHPLGRDFSFKSPEKIHQQPGVWKPTDPHWRDWVMANRTDLENGWTRLEPVRQWWSELSGFERIGDLTPTRPDAEIITFQPIRSFTQHACAMASLQAIDGHGDEALDTLLPVMEVSRKLEPSARTLVRLMVARVVQKTVLETVSFVLETTPVSAAARARFAAALSTGPGGEEEARRLLLLEYVWAATIVRDQSYGFLTASVLEEGPRWTAHFLPPANAFVFNPRRTVNAYGDLTAELQELAGHRQTVELELRQKRFFEQEGRMRFKNLGGSLLLSRMIPSYSKLIVSYWNTEDLRAAVLSRLRT